MHTLLATLPPMALGDVTNLKGLLTAVFGLVLLAVAVYAGVKAMKGSLSTVVTIAIGVIIAFGIARLATLPFDEQTTLGGQLLSLIGAGG